MSRERANNGRVALVTGAGQGIGEGIARALAAAGWTVAVTDVLADRAQGAAARLTAEGHRAAAWILDVVDSARWAMVIAEVVARFGGLDALVNNAGISPRGTIPSTDESLWQSTLAINLTGPFLGIRACWPHLAERQGGIVNIGSTRATRPMRGMLSYCTSKAGLHGLTRQTAVEGLSEGITCNMVAPGWVDTPGEREIQRAVGRPDFPEGLKNLTTSEDIGAAVVYLLSPAGRRANGVTLYLDAGLHVADDAGMVYLPDTDTRRYK